MSEYFNTEDDRNLEDPENYGEIEQPMKSRDWPTEAVISISTGRLICKFPVMHELIEYLLGRPVWTHELASEGLTELLKRGVFEQYPGLQQIAPESIDKDNWQQRQLEFKAKYGNTLTLEPFAQREFFQW